MSSYRLNPDVGRREQGGSKTDHERAELFKSQSKVVCAVTGTKMPAGFLKPRAKDFAALKRQQRDLKVPEPRQKYIYLVSTLHRTLLGIFPSW